MRESRVCRLRKRTIVRRYVLVRFSCPWWRGWLLECLRALSRWLPTMNRQTHARSTLITFPIPLSPHYSAVGVDGDAETVWARDVVVSWDSPRSGSREYRPSELRYTANLATVCQSSPVWRRICAVTTSAFGSFLPCQTVIPRKSPFGILVENRALGFVPWDNVWSTVRKGSREILNYSCSLVES